jgi:carboxymethylenebutenolidase
VVPFYGLLSHSHGLLAQEGGLDPKVKPREPIEAARDLACPLLAFFGEDDEYITGEDVESLQRVVDATPRAAEIVRFSGAGHAFMNDTRPDAYRPDAAQQAWARMVDFLRQHVGSA